MQIDVQKLEETSDVVVYAFLPRDSPGGRIHLRRLPEASSPGLERYATAVVLADHRESARYVIPVLNAIERAAAVGEFPSTLSCVLDLPDDHEPEPLAVAMAVPGSFNRVIALGVQLEDEGPDDAA